MPFICEIRQRNEDLYDLFEIGGRDKTTASYDVGGVISPRPFRLRRLGPIGGVVYDGYQEVYACERFDGRQVAGVGVMHAARPSAAEAAEWNSRETLS